ncbi:hypothetical protein FRC17_002124, partial [Serendipita sp. 399]
MPTPVKDLVGIYESRTSSPISDPAPRPARFLRHPARRESAPVASTADAHPEQEPINPSGGSIRQAEVGRRNTQSDIREPNIRPSTVQRVFYSSSDEAKSADERRLSPEHSSPTWVSSRFRPTSSKTSVVMAQQSRRNDNTTPLKRSIDSDQFTLNSAALSVTRASDITRISSNELAPKLSHSAYSPAPYHDSHDNDSPMNLSSKSRSIFTHLKKPSSSNAYVPLLDLSQKPHQKPNHVLHRHAASNNKHQPIPATEVFSRKAVPLYLPHLDELLASISQPDFDTGVTINNDPPPSKGKTPESSKPGIFKPLQKLNGKTLDELHHNSPPPSFLTDKNSILSSIVTGAIGVAGSSAIASYYSLQGVYDGVQIFALILSSV